MIHLKAFVYKTDFSSERENYFDIIFAFSIFNAETRATKNIRSDHSNEYGRDEWASVKIIGPIASSCDMLLKRLKEIK